MQALKGLENHHYDCTPPPAVHVIALKEQIKMSEGKVAQLEEQLAHQTPLPVGGATQLTGRGVAQGVGGAGVCQTTGIPAGDVGPLQNSLTEAEEHVRSLQGTLHLTLCVVSTQ